MNKLTSTVILAAFTAVCSFSAFAGSHDSDKNEPSSTSEVMHNKMPKDLPEGVKQEYRDQEVMNKKPYKQQESASKKGEPGSTSEVMHNKMPKDLPEGVKQEYRDQEVMNKKPYKQPNQ